MIGSRSSAAGERFRILILGGGTAGWMVAAALSRYLPRQAFHITLVESPQIGTVGVGEATIPLLRQFNEFIGLSEDEFLQRTQATFKLGINFQGWGDPKDAYLHPFIDFGFPKQGVGLCDAVQQAHHIGLDGANLQSYLLPNALAQRNRFCSAERLGPAGLDSHTYAYHIDATAYADLLRGMSIPAGVVHLQDLVSRVELRDTDAIDSVHLAQNGRIAADFFVDCSGFRSVLLGGALKGRFEDWSHWLPCNRALTAPSAPADPLPPYTRAIAHSGGWRWQIPLRHRTGNGVVYSSDFCTADQAAQRLVSDVPGLTRDPGRVIEFRTGVQAQQWQHNCVAMGLAAGFLEPLESTSIYLVQVAINELLRHFPAAQEDSAARTTFNELMAKEYDIVRDFIIAHYHLNGRVGEPMWDYCRTMTLPDSLAEKLAIYKACGFVTPQPRGLFQASSWHIVCTGQGHWPQRPSLTARSLSASDLAQVLSHRKAQIRQALATSPSNSEALAGALAGGGLPELTEGGSHPSAMIS